MGRPVASHPIDITELVVRSQAGDHDAYRIIVDSHAPLLRGWYAQRVPFGLDPDDLAHQTFVTAFFALDRFTPGTDLASWLISIARTTLLEALRRQRRDRYAPLDPALLVHAASSAADDEHFPALLDRLRQCLERLPQQARCLVDHYYRDGLSLEAIAGRDARSVSAVKARLHRVRRLLADCIGAP
jgi:RNA polymerase sigma-70 factor (ECF subfamily)